MTALSTAKCDTCGRFIAHEAMTSGSARYHFIPDSLFSREDEGWTCERCVRAEDATTAQTEAILLRGIDELTRPR